MDNHDFVVMTKKHCLDDVVEQIIGTLKAPRIQNNLQGSRIPVEQSAGQWINNHSVIEQHRSEWYNRLTEGDQGMVRDIVEDCAETAVASFFALLDGVGGSYGGVFEIVAVDSANQRYLLNPENTEMLHDLFSEACEEGRQNTDR